VKVFYTADDVTSEEVTAAPTDALTQEPGGIYCTVCFHSTMIHSDAKVQYVEMCHYFFARDFAKCDEAIVKRILLGLFN